MTRFVFEIRQDEEGRRLDKVLARRLDESMDGGFSRKKTKKLLDANKVKRNGGVERIASRRLEAGDEVEVHVDPQVAGKVKSRKQVNLSPDNILWEDEFIIAIDKPAGLPSQVTRDPRRDHAVAALKRYLKWRGVENPYVALHHRLDVGTSGVLVFARDKRANKGLAEAFRERKVTKIYRAVCWCTDREQQHRAGERWVVDNHLAEEGRGAERRQVAVHSGGDWAKTEFEVLSKRGRVYLVEARPLTGRRHQIRVHLAGRGLPIVGDERYGGPMDVESQKVERMMLHAHRLMMDHPVQDMPVVIESPLPESLE